MHIFISLDIALFCQFNAEHATPAIEASGTGVTLILVWVLSKNFVTFFSLKMVFNLIFIVLIMIPYWKFIGLI